MLEREEDGARALREDLGEIASSGKQNSEGFPNEIQR
jgi:hypothetical protein